MREHKTPPEITIVLRSRDGWTIPQIAEITLYSRDLLAAQLGRWEDIPGEVAAEAVKALRAIITPDPILGMSVTALAGVCRIPYQMAYRWATHAGLDGRTPRGEILLSCREAGEILLSCREAGEILRRRNRSVRESERLESWFEARGLPADAGD